MYGRYVYMRRRLAALGGRFHGYVKNQKIALTVSVTFRLRGPLDFIPSDATVVTRVAACVRVYGLMAST